MHRRIVFEKFNEPFISPEDVDPETMEMIKERWQNSMDIEPGQIFPSDMKVIDIEDEDSSDERNNIKFIMSPMGIMAIDKTMLPHSLFNFWVAHTNFKITKEFSVIIDKTDGVETLEFISQYRFKFATGKLFKPSLVFNNIKNNLGIEDISSLQRLQETRHFDILPEFLQEEVKKIKGTIPIHDDWLIYVFPNNTMTYIHGQSNDKEFRHKQEVYLECYKMVGGHIFSSRE